MLTEQTAGKAFRHGADYWNGSVAPFGYRTYVCETVGRKQKKKLEVDEVEATTVRMIFRLAPVGDMRSGPMGVKAIASHLNASGHRTRRGKLWHVGPLHALLTNPVYKGAYVYNRSDSRSRRPRPVGEHVEVPCPEIVGKATWDSVQQHLRSRNPKIAPPKTVTGPILLTGLLHCADCEVPTSFPCARQRAEQNQVTDDAVDTEIGEISKS